MYIAHINGSMNTSDTSAMVLKLEMHVVVDRPSSFRAFKRVCSLAPAVRIVCET